MELQQPQQSIIPLSLLIDYLVQKTYHDLIVLSELLPRKSDVERKTSIYQFSNRTNQQFVRLLALVKWACKASRVDKCTEIIMFLDKQAALFVETANNLFFVANESMKDACVPVFNLQTSVDVLVGGTYSRLPTAIKEKIIPKGALTSKEREDTLDQLTGIIEQRLVLSKIPTRFKSIKIHRGFVELTVPHVFSVKLTVSNDDFKQPWRLLSYEILVQNPLPDDPRPAIHYNQKEYITQLLSSRLFNPDVEPLHDLFTVAYSFGLLLQLEILYTQAITMRNTAWKASIMILDYQPGRILMIGYWRDLPLLGTQNAALVIYNNPDADPLDCYKVDHRPDIIQIPSRDMIKLDESNLSLEQLLLQSIQHRSYQFLSNLRDKLKQIPNIKIPKEYEDDFVEDELKVTYYGHIILTFSVYVYTGVIFCECNYKLVPQELIKAVNENTSLFDALQKIRRQVQLLTIKTKLLSLEIKHHLNLNIINTMDFPDLMTVVTGFYVRFKNNANYCLVFDLSKEKIRYLLLKISPAVTTADNKHVIQYRVITCIEVTEIPVFGITNTESCDPIDVFLLMERAILYVLLQDEWKKKGQRCLGIVPISNDLNYCLRLLTLPTNHPVLKQLLKDLIVHVHCISPSVVKYTLSFNTNHPSLPANTLGTVQPLYSSNLKVIVDKFSIYWKGIHYLFTLVYNYQALKNNSLGRIVRYNFNSTVISYNIESNEFKVYIDPKQNKFNLRFFTSNNGDPNPHSLIREHLEHELGIHACIFKLLVTLKRTFHLYRILYDIPQMTYFGFQKATPTYRALWTFLVHSCNAVRLIFNSCMAVDIMCYTSERYSIKDAASTQNPNQKFLRYSSIHLLHKLVDIIAKKVDDATYETIAVMVYPSADPKYPAVSPQPATPGYPHGPSTPHSLPGTPSTGNVGYQQPGTPGYPQPTTPGGYPNPSPISSKPQPSPQNPSPFVQPNPSPMGAPSPALMSLMSPQTPQYMPPSPAPVPSPSSSGAYIQQPSPGTAQHILGSPNYRNPNPAGPQTSYGITPSPNSGNKVQARTPRASSTLYINKSMLEALLDAKKNPFDIKNKRSALENFMSVCLRKRHIASVVTELKGLTLRSNEIMVTTLNHEVAVYRFSIDSATLQTLQFSVKPLQNSFWTKHLLDTLSSYFAMKIAPPPFEINAIPSFLRILASSKEILVQFINLMSLEMNPENEFEWRMSLCLIIPPEIDYIAHSLQAGIPGIIFSNTKILFYVRLSHSRRPYHPVVVPLLYDTNVNNIKIPDIRPPDYMTLRIQEHLKIVNSNQGNSSSGVIASALAELLQNLNPAFP